MMPSVQNTGPDVEGMVGRGLGLLNASLILTLTHLTLPVNDEYATDCTRSSSDCIAGIQGRLVRYMQEAGAGQCV